MNTADKTILNVKLDKRLKRDAQALAEEIGVPLSTVVIANLKEFVRSRSLTLAAMPRLKTEVEAEIGRALAEHAANPKAAPQFTSPKAAADYLRQL